MINENEKDFLNFYMEQTWQEMRHIENLKERVTILVVTVASAVVGFTIQQRFAIETRPFLWFAFSLGLFGLLVTLGLIQIHRMQQRRLDEWYQYYGENCGNNSKILERRDQADKKNKKDVLYIAKLGYNYVWSFIHVFIVLASIFMLLSKNWA